MYFTIFRALVSIVCIIYFVDSSISIVKASQSPPTTEQSLHIAVASNFKSTAKLLIQAFNKSYPTKIILSSASTGKLTTQIRYGAPYDIFLAADTKHPKLLIDEKLAYKKSYKVYAQGQLALISNRSVAKSALAMLKALPRNSIVAIANPKTAPYGLTAEKWLSLSGFNERSFRYTKGENISQTWQFFQKGGADAAFVALSQILLSKMINSESNKYHYWLLPQKINQNLQQASVILKTAANRDIAELFLVFLQSEKAQQIIQQAGYRLISL